jgi:glycosyltransferase involved in cell wall biosynthesis
MTKNVEFLGVMDNIHELLCSMDVMIFPSLFEGLPVTLVEAQAAGLKILASDRISNEVLLTDDICLKSIQSSADEWASCAIEVAMDSRKTDNAVDMIRKGFDMSHNVKLLENKYMDLVKGK